MAYAERLDGKIPDAMAEKVGWIQAIRTAPYFAHAQFSSPETILALPDPGDQFPLIKAMWHYARGVALAAQKEVAKAQSEAAQIAELNQKSDFSYLLAWAVPAPDLLNLARHVVEGRIAQAQGNLEQAIKEFEIAVSIQDTLAYMEPPYWYYPVRQTLGAALVQAGRAPEAETIFAQALENTPKNGWALYGLMEAQKAQGKQDEAQATQKRLQQAWMGDPAQLDLGRL
jgi:tetratricopeptide (TPR) repeat protein